MTQCLREAQETSPPSGAVGLGSAVQVCAFHIEVTGGEDVVGSPLVAAPPSVATQNEEPGHETLWKPSGEMPVPTESAFSLDHQTPFQ